MRRSRRPPFADRAAAGRQLAGRLTHLRGADVVVVGLPRGGVAVAAEVADALSLPLDVVLVRKLGVPTQPELALGAVGEGGVLVLNEDVLALTGVGLAQLEGIVARERVELQRRARRLRRGGPAPCLAGRTVVVVDDGIATGATARAACRVARAQGAARVVLAAPVCSPRTAGSLQGDADELVVAAPLRDADAVGRAYGDFRPVSEDEVAALLHRAAPSAPC